MKRTTFLKVCSLIIVSTGFVAAEGPSYYESQPDRNARIMAFQQEQIYKAQDALRRGTITQQEYDELVKHYIATTKKLGAL